MDYYYKMLLWLSQRKETSEVSRKCQYRNQIFFPNIHQCCWNSKGQLWLTWRLHKTCFVYYYYFPSQHFPLSKINPHSQIYTHSTYEKNTARRQLKRESHVPGLCHNKLPKLISKQNMVSINTNVRRAVLICFILTFL